MVVAVAPEHIIMTKDERHRYLLIVCLVQQQLVCAIVVFVAVAFLLILSQAIHQVIS